jgi:EmrB/QacA subfamily drug resistance transporter
MVSKSARGALASLSLSLLLASLGTSIANVALPTLATAFDATFQQVQWVVLAYLLAVTALIVGIGRLGDLLGRRRVLLAGLLLFTLASVLCGAAPTLALLIAARTAQGLGAAVMMSLSLALVAEAVPKERTGRAMGLLGTMSAVGTALGPSLGGILIAALGWRAIFFVTVPLGLASLLMAYRWLPADRARVVGAGKGFDVPGMLVLALTLTSYALAMTLGRGRFGVLNVALLAGAGAGLGIFVAVQARAASPLIQLPLLRNPVVASGLAGSALVSTVMMATLVVGPFYLSLSLGLSTAFVGVVAAVGPLVAALAGVPAGRIVDRFGAQRMSLIGLIGMGAGVALLSLPSTNLGVAGYIVPIALTTAFYALFQAANNTAVMSELHAEQRGVVSGMLNLSRNLGLITGASVLGAVFAVASSATDIKTARPEDVATGMRITFAVTAGLIALAIAFAIRARNPAGRAALRSETAKSRLETRQRVRESDSAPGPLGSPSTGAIRDAARTPG